MIISTYKDCAIMQFFCIDDMINAIKDQKKIKSKYKVGRIFINNLHSENFETFNF